MLNDWAMAAPAAARRARAVLTCMIKNVVRQNRKRQGTVQAVVNSALKLKYL